MQFQEKEIDFIDYLRIICKRKYILFSVVAVFCFIIALIVMKMPKVYEYSMSINVQGLAMNATVLNDKIKQGYYDSSIIQSLKLPPGEKCNFDISLQPDSSVLIISLKQKGEINDSKKLILRRLYEIIVQDNDKMLIYEKVRIEQENTKKIEQLKSIEERIRKLGENALKLDKKYNDLIETNYNLIMSSNSIDIGKVILTSSVLKHLEIAKADKKEELNTLKEKKEGVRKSIISYDNLYKRLQKNIEITVSIDNKQIIVRYIFYGIAAGLFLVFIIEFLEKIKNG